MAKVESATGKNKTVQVQANGSAPKGLSAGDKVVTAGGTYTITSVNKDGSYNSTKTSNETTSTYKGSYTSAADAAKAAAATANAAAQSVKTANKSKSSSTSSSPASTGYSATAAEQAARAAANTANQAAKEVKATNAAKAAAATANTAVTTPAPTTQAQTPTGYVGKGTYEDADIRATNAAAAAEIDKQKQAYAQYQALRDAALARGDTNAAAEYVIKMREAHDKAELVRAQYGYSGGTDGSENITTPQNTGAINWSVDYSIGNQNDPYALNAYDKAFLTPQEQQVMVALKQQYAAAPTAAEKAAINQQANELRAQHGYSLGADGDTFTKLTKPEEEQNALYQQTIQAYEPNYDLINQVYDKLNDSTLAQLLAAYNNSRAQTEYDMSKLPALYQAQRNAVSADNEREKAAFREQAAASGLNAGNRGQAALAYSNQLMNSLGQLNTAEANALADAQHSLTQLYNQYQQEISSAVAQNNYQRAGELVNEMQTAAQSIADTSAQQANLNIATSQLNEQIRQNNIAQQNQEWQQKYNIGSELANYGNLSVLGNLGGLSNSDIQRAQLIYNLLRAGGDYPILKAYGL